MFGMTGMQWREANPELKGNIRDCATINELICHSNMEHINAVLIIDGKPQGGMKLFITSNKDATMVVTNAHQWEMKKVVAICISGIYDSQIT